MSQELRAGAVFELLPHVEHKDRGELGRSGSLIGKASKEAVIDCIETFDTWASSCIEPGGLVAMHLFWNKTELPAEVFRACTSIGVFLFLSGDFYFISFFWDRAIRKQGIN